MARSCHFRHWGITARVILITILPVILFFAAVLVYSYTTRLHEVEQELSERGNGIASVIADSSDYAVISGNLATLSAMTAGLLRRDPSISRIVVQAADGHVLAEFAAGQPPQRPILVTAAPIRRQVLAVESFADQKAPHLSTIGPKDVPTVQGEVLGNVNVTMSGHVVLARQLQRSLVAAGIAALVLVLCALLGTSLAMSLTRPLATTINAVRRISEGDYTTALPVTATGEIGHLQTSIVAMATKLREFREDLEGQVISRTKALEAARDEALHSNVEKRKLLRRLEAVVELERQNIAVEIHDRLNASLVVVRLEAQQILALLDNDTSTLPAQEIRRRAQSVVELSSDLYETGRAIVRQLRPEVIDTLGLREAVRGLVQHYDELLPKCRFEFETSGEFRDLDPSTSIVAYRVIQEALSNVLKHSGATCCNVVLDADDSRAIVRIVVADDGIGFNPRLATSGIGIAGMRERVDGHGGKWNLSTTHEQGTRVTIELPFHPT